AAAPPAPGYVRQADFHVSGAAALEATFAPHRTDPAAPSTGPRMKQVLAVSLGDSVLHLAPPWPAIWPASQRAPALRREPERQYQCERFESRRAVPFGREWRGTPPGGRRRHQFGAGAPCRIGKPRE